MKLIHMMQAVLVALCWGGNYVAARIALDTLPPLWLLTLRFAIVGLILLPFFPKPATNIKDMFVLSILLGTLHFSLMFVPIHMGLDVSSAVISSQLGVPFSCLLGSILLKDRIGPWRSLGMLISFIGIIIIAGSPRIAEQYIPFMIACAAAFAWAVSNIYLKKLQQVNMLGVLCWVSIFSVPQLALLSFLFEEGQLQTFERSASITWIALGYTILLSTLVAYGLWYSLMSRFPLSQVVPYSLLVPVFGLVIAQWFFAEPLTWQFITGGLFTIAGVAIIVLRRPENAKLDQN